MKLNMKTAEFKKRIRTKLSSLLKLTMSSMRTLQKHTKFDTEQWQIFPGHTVSIENLQITAKDRKLFEQN